MSRQADIVGEFRGIIDTVIDRQVENARRNHRSWLDMDKEAKIAGLTFGRYEARGGRSSVFGSGALWGIHTGKVMFEQTRMRGFLAIVSPADQLDSLQRNWSFITPMQMLNADTEKKIEDVNSLETVLSWAKSPHIEDLGHIALLDDDELENVTGWYDRMAESRREAAKDLEAISRMHRRPIPNTPIG